MLCHRRTNLISMAYISKILRCSSKCYGERILAMLHVNENTHLARSNCTPHCRNRSSHVKNDFNTQRNVPFFATKSNPKKKVQNQAVRSSKFSKLNLSMIVQNSQNLREGAVLSLFHKILSVYYLNLNMPSFQKDIQSFSKSAEFNQFCKILNANLRSLPPNVLIQFLYLENFRVHVQNPVMQNILFLIYDNINCFSLSEILEIYVTLKRPFFQKNQMRENILKACLKYFEEVFEDELSHFRDAYELVYYLQDNVLPLFVRKLLAEKYFDFMERKCFRTPLYIHLFTALFQEPLISIYRSQVLKHLKNTIGVLGTGLTVKTLSSIYENGIYNDETNYDEEVCSILIKKTCTPKIPFFGALRVIENLCLMGHFNYDSINYVANNVLSERLYSDLALKVVSIFVRTSFHEQNYNDWNQIKIELQKLNALEQFPDMNDLVKWCEYLTFLGCDTRDLLSHIFKTVNSQENNLLTGDDCELYRRILSLHHFATAHVSNGYERLTKKTVSSCIEKAKLKNEFFQRFCLNEALGSEDFFLKNCITSSQNFIPAVMVLGPNNKPINLSSYKIDNTIHLKTGSFRKFQEYYNIDKIEKPPGSKMVVFDCFLDRQPYKFRNAPIESGVYRIFVESIKSVKSNVVVFNARLLNSSNEKRLQFVKSKLDEIIRSREAEANDGIIFK